MKVLISISDPDMTNRDDGILTEYANFRLPPREEGSGERFVDVKFFTEL